jgi:hypothetical protein
VLIIGYLAYPLISPNLGEGRRVSLSGDEQDIARLLNFIMIYIPLPVFLFFTLSKIFISCPRVVLTKAGLLNEAWKVGVVAWKDIESITLETRPYSDYKGIKLGREHYIQIKPTNAKPYLERKYGQGGTLEFLPIEWQINTRDLQADSKELYAQLKKFHIKYGLAGDSRDQNLQT